MTQRRRRPLSHEITAPRQVSNPALNPIGTAEGPLATRSAAAAIQEHTKAEDQVDATVVRAASHKEMLSWIGVFERLIVLPRPRSGIGHNLQPISDVEDQEIREAVAILKAQPVVPTAPDEARAAGSTLKKIGERLVTYLDTCLMEASKELGKRLVQLSYWWALWYALKNIVQSVEAWLR